jgi:L,D-peptidoglycan transpeptidase YkuD (ErfK/YbiS/YcfS/YnhG family)
MGLGRRRRRTAFGAIVLVLAIFPGGAVPGAVRAAGPIGGGARPSAAARRDVPWRPDASCDLATVADLAARHPEARQFIVLATAGFGATTGEAFVAARRADGAWVCQTATVAASFGRNGTRPLADRRSGDDTTPAGVFPLGRVTAWDGQTFNVFGNDPDPGVRGNVTYRSVRNEDCWGATPGAASYNHLVNRPNCPGPSDEWLPRFSEAYSHAVVIGANLDPISGDAPGETPFAAAIFLHRNSYTASGQAKPTSGCVSLSADDLATFIRLLDPALSTRFAIGPTSYLRSNA